MTIVDDTLLGLLFRLINHLHNISKICKLVFVMLKVIDLQYYFSINDMQL